MTKQEPQKANLASLLFLKEENKVLLMRRKTGVFKGLYTFVSGKVDDGETFTDAIIREVKEEANIDLKKEDLKVFHIAQEVGDNYIHTYFVADKWSGEIKNMEPHKCDDLDWFDLDNLPENTVYLVANMIKKANKGEFYSEFRTYPRKND